MKKKGVKKHPVRVENMNMIEKVALPGPLVTSLMKAMLKVPRSSGCDSGVTPSCRYMVMTPLVSSLVFK